MDPFCGQVSVHEENILSEGDVLSAGVMGSVEMDEFGDRQIDFAMWDMMDADSGEFQVKHR